MDWIKRYILVFDKRHPNELGAGEIEAFLTHFAVNGRVAASTQNQALSALLFLYREVLGQDLPWMENVIRAKKPERLPTVLSGNEVIAVLECHESPLCSSHRLHIPHIASSKCRAKRAASNRGEASTCWRRPTRKLASRSRSEA